ncbi:hypothetical protein BD408DRAFT_206142 [Parasitella parasitica]|nr:hypothetical protein BD408DRAFT_206142 [Parasitella parasitica]
MSRHATVAASISNRVIANLALFSIIACVNQRLHNHTMANLCDKILTTGDALATRCPK